MTYDVPGAVAWRVEGLWPAASQGHGLEPAEADVELATSAPPVPVTRDRYVDLLRAASILAVVLGHWLMAAVTWGGGEIETGNLLTVVPVLQPVTWLLQVMPVFFVVGGFANAGSWRSTVRRGGAYADFVHHRVGRLLRPVWPFLALWVVVAAVLAATGSQGGAVTTAMLVAVQPLWFIGLYVLAVACTPVMLAAHRRWGAWVLVVLAVVVVAVDVVRIATPWTAVGYANYAAVWLLAHQVGFFHADGVADRIPRPALWLTAGAALVALTLLTTVGPYPVSMVGLPGDRLSNLAPPTLCVVVLTAWLVSVALLARPVLTRWVRRPRVWSAVVATNASVMTIFLWHLTVLVLLVLACSWAGVVLPPVASLGWWLLRPVWLGALAVLLLGVVRMVGRFERAGLGRRGAVTGVRGEASVVAALGVAWVVLGLSGLALSGLAGLWSDRHVALLHMTVNPVLDLVSLLLGAALVQVAVRRARGWWLGLAAAVLLVAASGPATDAWWPAAPAPDLGGALSYLVTALVLLVLAVRPRNRDT
jgi:fucose 4-O-acetylase-like acetyltransferase